MLLDWLSDVHRSEKYVMYADINLIECQLKHIQGFHTQPTFIKVIIRKNTI